MKKIMILVLAALLLVLPAQQAFAASEFSLVNQEGAIGSYDPFFKGLSISSAYSPQQSNYTLTGTNSIERPYEDELIDCLDQWIINISGTYDPLTGGFDGTFHMDSHRTGQWKSDSRNIQLQNILADGELTGIASPGDKDVAITFLGTGIDGLTKDSFEVSLTANFKVEGALPFTQTQTEAPVKTPETEETAEPEETAQHTPSKSALRDSGVRFSDLAGEVEICIPTGYDANGEPVYNEEAWDSAELENVLPVGTLIKTHRNSSGILAFADMTTYIMKPGTTIRLPSPAEKDSQFQLLVGGLWVNAKKILKGEDLYEGQLVVASIKGTTFVLEEDGETSTLKVIEGTVELKLKATGKSVMVESGKMVSATKDGLGDVKTFDTVAEMADWKQYGAALPQEGFPLWAILAIGGVVIFAVVIVIVAVSSRRKKRLAAVARPSVPAQGTYPPSAPPSPAQSAFPPAPGFFCIQCGAPLESGVEFCAKCGRKRDL